jgi:hypothetical protein
MSDSTLVLRIFGGLGIFSPLVVSLFLTSGIALAHQQLGDYPLCEGSAALQMSCPGGEAPCLLVGDNEQQDKLFVFPMGREGHLQVLNQRELDLGRQEISDIEALTPGAAGKILLFGSHSRNTRCEDKDKRRRFASIRISGDRVTDVQIVESKKITCQRLFDDHVLTDPVLQAVCSAIDSAEDQANTVAQQLEDGSITEEAATARCNEITPFNAEGAVAIPMAASPDFWIGLRAPLLAQHPDHPDYAQLALLLHMKDLTAYRFRGAAFLDLGGRGVRELAFLGGEVWVIAGPAADQAEPFQLWRFAARMLSHGAIINPTLVATLPASAEGLVVTDKVAYVIIDGDADKDNERCLRATSYQVIELSAR